MCRRCGLREGKGRRGERRRRGEGEWLYLGHNAEGEDEHIVCLQVSVDDIVLVQECQGTGHLAEGHE